jgi:hypothetical protein
MAQEKQKRVGLKAAQASAKRRRDSTDDEGSVQGDQVPGPPPSPSAAARPLPLLPSLSSLSRLQAPDEEQSDDESEEDDADAAGPPSGKAPVAKSAGSGQRISPKGKKKRSSTSALRIKKTIKKKARRAPSPPPSDDDDDGDFEDEDDSGKAERALLRIVKPLIPAFCRQFVGGNMIGGRIDDEDVVSVCPARPSSPPPPALLFAFLLAACMHSPFTHTCNVTGRGFWSLPTNGGASRATDLFRFARRDGRASS